MLKDASKCIQECNSQIRNIVEFLGESDYPKLKEARVKVFGYSDQELQEIRKAQQEKAERERAELSRRKAELRAVYNQVECELLANFKDLRVFDSGGIDYLHTETGRPRSGY